VLATPATTDEFLAMVMRCIDSVPVTTDPEKHLVAFACIAVLSAMKCPDGYVLLGPTFGKDPRYYCYLPEAKP